MMTATDEGQPKAATVLVSMPLPCNGAGVSYTCTSIVRSFDRSALGVSIFTPYGHAGVKASTRLTETMPAALRLLPFWRIRKLATRLNERSYLEGVRTAAARGRAVAYVWPEPAVSVVQEDSRLRRSDCKGVGKLPSGDRQENPGCRIYQVGLGAPTSNDRAIYRFRAPGARPLRRYFLLQPATRNSR